MSEPTSSQYLSAVDEIILRSAVEILRRTGSTAAESTFDGGKQVSEVLNIGGVRERCNAASDAINYALISLAVNAKHHPAAEPQSLRA